MCPLGSTPFPLLGMANPLAYGFVLAASCNLQSMTCSREWCQKEWFSQWPNPLRRRPYPSGGLIWPPLGIVLACVCERRLSNQFRLACPDASRPVAPAGGAHANFRRAFPARHGGPPPRGAGYSGAPIATARAGSSIPPSADSSASTPAAIYDYLICN